MDFMTKEESYVERRQLFKNIWETAMHIDEKDIEIMNKPKVVKYVNKPKVIKTLRLDEVDKCMGKKKKQRIKNLRTVCNKILDFCDRQDADDIFYEQIAAAGQERLQHKAESLPKKGRANKTKKKPVKKAKSLFSPVDILAQPKVTTSEQRDNFTRNAVTRTSRNTSPVKRMAFANSQITNKSLKLKMSPRITGAGANNVLGDTSATTGQRQKVTTKKKHKKKKTVDYNIPGFVTKFKYESPRTLLGRAATIPTKQLLQVHKVML